MILDKETVMCAACLDGGWSYSVVSNLRVVSHTDEEEEKIVRLFRGANTAAAFTRWCDTYNIDMYKHILGSSWTVTPAGEMEVTYGVGPPFPFINEHLELDVTCDKMYGLGTMMAYLLDTVFAPAGVGVRGTLLFTDDNEEAGFREVSFTPDGSLHFNTRSQVDLMRYWVAAHQ